MTSYKTVFLGLAFTWFFFCSVVSAENRFDAGVLSIPVVQVEKERYSVNLNLTDASTLTFQVDLSSLANVTSVTTGTGTDPKFQAGKLTIQQVRVGNDIYFVILSIADPVNLTFQVDLTSLKNITQPLSAAHAQQAYIKASNTGKNDRFGSNAIALDGDTLVIGAPGETGLSSGINGDQTRGHPSKDRWSGAVYVFIRKSGVWSQQAYLKASNRDSPDKFGAAVAISGDTIAVGAPGESSSESGVNANQLDNSLASSGAAYIFKRDNNVWAQQTYIKAPNPDNLDGFGESVALDGNTLAVGSIREDSLATGINGDTLDNSGNNVGAVYVYTRIGKSWSFQAYLKASNANHGAFFGLSLGVSGDTIVVGSPQESHGGEGVSADDKDPFRTHFSGAAYVFVRNGETWSQQAYLKASNPDNSDFFGVSVAISGDTIAVGADGEGGGATGVNGDQSSNSPGSTGAVYVFTRNASSWQQQAYIKASNTNFNDGFGGSAALSGNTLVVGAPREASAATGVNGDQSDNSSDFAGAAYVFTRKGDTWSQHTYLKASNTDTDDHFGHKGSVAVSGDTIAVGAPFEESAATGINGDQTDNSLVNAGAVYVFQ